MEINKPLLKAAFGWGFLLWLFGYVLSMILFMLVPPNAIGWIITPIATCVALWVLIKKINCFSLSYYAVIGICWAVLAVVLDYFFIVKALKPQDGYYKLDVYLYYFLTLLLPLIAGWWKLHKRR